MNLIISWGYPVDNEPFRKLLKTLDVKHCVAIGGGKPIKPFTNDVIFENVNLDEHFNFYKSTLGETIPLDAEIIEKMKPYQETAMDIIYRWRRSISTKESYKEIKEIYYTYLRYWNHVIVTKKIDLLILFNLPHVPITYFIYALCKIHKIPTVVQVLGPVIKGELRNKYITDDINRLDCDFSNRYIKALEAFKLVPEEKISVDGKFAVYFEQYTGLNETIQRVIAPKRKKNYLSNIVQYYTRAKIYVSTRRYKILFKKIIYLFKMGCVSNSVLRYYENIEQKPELEEKFFFFPMHLQPEATTLPHAEPFIDQRLIIHLLSFCLPDGIKIYVKEHPAFWEPSKSYESIKETRSKDFYNEIANLKNVRIIEHNYNSLELVDKSLCVVTGTGTVGIEALFKLKPVLFFGNHFYSFMPGAFKIRTKEDCILAVKKILSQNYHSHTIKDLKIFFKALEPIVVSIGVNEGLEKMEDFLNMEIDECGEETLKGIINFIMICFPELLVNKMN